MCAGQRSPNTTKDQRITQAIIREAGSAFNKVIATRPLALARAVQTDPPPPSLLAGALSALQIPLIHKEREIIKTSNLGAQGLGVNSWLREPARLFLSGSKQLLYQR